MYSKLTTAAKATSRWFDDNFHKYATTMLLLVGLLYVVAHSFGPYVGLVDPTAPTPPMPTPITTPTPLP